MYKFKLKKVNSAFDETIFTTDDVDFALFIAESLEAELYYWERMYWWEVDSDFIERDRNNGPFGKNTIKWPY